MGQKVHPSILRVGSSLKWKSKWYSSNKIYNSNIVMRSFELYNFCNNSFFSKYFLINSINIFFYNEKLVINIHYALKYESFVIKKYFEEIFKKFRKKHNITSNEPCITRDYIIYNFKHFHKKNVKLINFYNYFFFKSSIIKHTKYTDAFVRELDIDRLCKSLTKILSFKLFSLYLFDDSFDYRQSISKKNISLKDSYKIKEFSYIIVMINKTQSSLLIANFIKLYLEDKKSRKQQTFFLGNLRRFILQNSRNLESIKGLKIEIKGRLNGRDRSTRYIIKLGKLPLQSIKESIDYTFLPAFTLDGVVSIKTWVVPI